MVVGCGLLVIGWFVLYYPQPTTNNQEPTPNTDLEEKKRFEYHSIAELSITKH